MLTFLPTWAPQAELDLAALPTMRQVTKQCIDIFARWADRNEDHPFPNGSPAKWNDEALRSFLPYREDFLGKHGWRCGSPLCYRSKRLQTWITHPNVFVLDLATYNWSRTLKDPRTWAIVNVARDNNLRHLAAWTAGNAGLSLAMLVRAANQFMPADGHLRAYALYDQYDKSVRGTVLATLQSWESVNIPVPSVAKAVFPPDQIAEKVADRAVALSGGWKAEEYWEVTDGWDAVGMIMYRLLFAQVIRELKPTHIVAPLGTGNLIMGIILAVDDCEVSGAIASGSVTVVGAEPGGKQNLTTQIKRRRQIPDEESEQTSTRPPLMPKIANTYSALLACIENAFERTQLRSQQADYTDQVQAGHQLATPARGRRIRAEPSSLAAFAVLPKLRRELYESDMKDQRILVINSGFGLLSEQEQEFMKQFGI